MRLVLNLWLGSCWPLGQPEYRTGVSESERLRKMVYGCGANLSTQRTRRTQGKSGTVSSEASSGGGWNVPRGTHRHDGNGVTILS